MILGIKTTSLIFKERGSKSTVIITHPSTFDYQELDNSWVARFFNGAKKLQKEDKKNINERKISAKKILAKEKYQQLKKYEIQPNDIESVCSKREKENVVPAASRPKKLFYHDILNELMNNPTLIHGCLNYFSHG
ncbi:6904_t:CDS:2, partial [Scutellospora calospora]